MIKFAHPINIAMELSIVEIFLKTNFFNMLFFLLRPLRNSSRILLGSRARIVRLVALFWRWYKVSFDKCSLWFSTYFTMEGWLRPSSDVMLLLCRTKLQFGSTVAWQEINSDSDVVPESNQIRGLLEPHNNSPPNLPRERNLARTY